MVIPSDECPGVPQRGCGVGALRLSHGGGAVGVEGGVGGVTQSGGTLYSGCTCVPAIPLLVFINTFFFEDRVWIVLVFPQGCGVYGHCGHSLKGVITFVPSFIGTIIVSCTELLSVVGAV